MQFLTDQEFDGIVDADEAEDVGAGVEVDVGFAVAGFFADLPEGMTWAAEHGGGFGFLLEVRLDGEFHGGIDLVEEVLQDVAALAGAAIGGLRNVDGDVLEAAEAHVFGVNEHAVVADGGA